MGARARQTHSRRSAGQATVLAWSERMSEAPLARSSGSAEALDRNPAAIYLSRLAEGSRRTMGDALVTIACLLRPELREGLDRARQADPSGRLGRLVVEKRTILLSTPWETIRYAHAQAIRARLSEPPLSLSFSTVNRCLAALRGVGREAFKLELMSGDDYQRLAMIEPIKGSREPPGRMLDEDEIVALGNACDLSTSRGARNAVVLALTFGCGLRRAEAVSLDVKHLDARSWILRVRGKGNKEREVPIATSRRQPFVAWLGYRGRQAGPLLFAISKWGTISRRRMTDGAILIILSSLVRDASIGRLSPHDMRRTFISMLLDRGADLVTVQKLAGHVDPKTTARYDRRGELAKAKAVELLR